MCLPGNSVLSSTKEDHHNKLLVTCYLLLFVKRLCITNAARTELTVRKFEARIQNPRIGHMHVSCTDPMKNVKVKVQVSSLISSLATLHYTRWSLDLFLREPFQLHGDHTVLQPFRLI